MAESNSNASLIFELPSFSEFRTVRPRDWIDCFINATKCQGIVWSKAMDLLGTMLEGSAKDWFECLDETELCDPATFHRVFLARFAPDPKDVLAQGTTESVGKYYYRVLKLGRQFNKEDWEMNIDFVDGLREPIKSAVDKQFPLNFSDARNMATFWELRYAKKVRKAKSEPEPQSESTANVTNEDLSSDIKKLTDLMKSMFTKGKHENQTGIKCNYCDRYRHKESTCRLKRQNVEKLNFVRKMLVGLRSISGNGYYQLKCAYCLKQNHNDMAELACPLLKRDLQSQGLLPLA